VAGVRVKGKDFRVSQWKRGVRPGNFNGWSVSPPLSATC
jgi:hypothetical protein